eukprot:Skav229974  [mRNA]  locus=scaffold2343:36286:37512:- [translate_table: standard]
MTMAQFGRSIGATVIDLSNPGGNDFPNEDDDQNPSHSGNGDGGDPDDNDDDDDDDDEPESEADEPTDQCQNCQLLSIELNKWEVRCQALELIINSGFHEGTPIPDDQMELTQFIHQMKDMTRQATLKKQVMVGTHGYAIYLRNIEKNETKMVRILPKQTIKQLKVEVMLAFGYAKSHCEKFNYRIVEGHRTVNQHGLTVERREFLSKELNRLHIQNVFTDTAVVEVTVRGVGGGVMRTISKDGKVTKRDFIEKAQKDMCDKVKGKDFDFDLKSEKAVLEYIMNFSGSPAELFKVAVDAMDEPMALEFQKLFSDTSGKNGSTEDKVEAFTTKVLGARFRKLNSVIADCENLKGAMVLSMVKKYADWTLKGSRFDNSSLLHVISARLASLKSTGASTDDVAKAFQDMQIE